MESSQLHLEVDGKEVPVAKVLVHSQRDPFPGGHDYRLFLPAKQGQEWISELGLEPGSAGEFDDQLSWDGLYWLGSVLSGVMPSMVPDPCFVLNTISKVQRTEDGIWIQGICSPFVKSSAKGVAVRAAPRSALERGQNTLPVNQPIIDK